MPKATAPAKPKVIKKAVSLTQLGNAGFRIERITGFITRVGITITEKEVQNYIDSGEYVVTISRNK